MRTLVVSLLVTGPLALATQPALAAGPQSGQQTEFGVFSGVQVRVPLGAGPGKEAPTVSLGVAPTVRSERPDGSSRTMIGEGLQVSLAPEGPPTLNLAGTRLDQFRLGPDGHAPGGHRAGVSTLGWVGIGVGVVVVGVAGFYWWLSEEMECDPGEC